MSETRLRPKRQLKPIKHGTRNGYVTHRRRGEQPCTECLAAHAAYRAEYVATVVNERPEDIRHGTYSGYQFCRHTAAGPCAPCKSAASEYNARVRRVS